MEPLRLRHPDRDLWVPDGTDTARALRRSTDLGIGAHPDDLELLAIVPIGECAEDPDRWFTGVTCTDGAGSARTGPYAGLTDAEMVATRRAEQRTAARLGEYSAILQLGHASDEIRSEQGFDALVDEVASVIEATSPVDVYTHNLADKHGTHAVVAAATVHAVRRLPVSQRPARLVGLEGWRDLDWLPDGEKLRMDATAHASLAERLAAAHRSQVEGGKRYDLALQGRRRANATLFTISEADEAGEVVVAMDLTPLVDNDDLDPVAFVLGAVDRFRDEIASSLRTWFPA
jgi:LmbE family N-acetylglucosaminyl deacetylase